MPILTGALFGGLGLFVLYLALGISAAIAILKNTTLIALILGGLVFLFVMKQILK